MPNVPNRLPAVISSQGSSATATPRTAQVQSPLARQHTGDRLTQGAQDATDAATRAARALPIGNGNLFTGVSFAGGQPKVVAHRLGAKWRGFIVTKNDTHCWMKFAPQAASLDALQVTLVASANCTADLWIF